MSQPDVDQELARLLNATRAGTEPDGNARARARAALAVRLAGAGAAKAGLTTPVGLGAKLWLLSAFAVAVLIGGVQLARLDRSSPAPARLLPATPRVVVDPAIEPSSPAKVVPSVVATTSSTAAAQPSLSQPGVAAKTEQPADELALVSAMQLALRSNKTSRALALANEHARRFPAGALVQEREGARAIARCQLAEPAARRAIQSAFEAHYADSPYAARVKAACAL